MPTDAALLPPDRSVPGRYWLRYHDSKPGDEMMATWAPDRKEWALNGGMTPWQGYAYGYRLASPHPIPGPAALEAVYALLAALGDRVHERSALPNRYADGEADAFRAAADALLEAIETKETTDG